MQSPHWHATVILVAFSTENRPSLQQPLSWGQSCWRHISAWRAVSHCSFGPLTQQRRPPQAGTPPGRSPRDTMQCNKRANHSKFFRTPSASTWRKVHALTMDFRRPPLWSFALARTQRAFSSLGGIDRRAQSSRWPSPHCGRVSGAEQIARSIAAPPPPLLLHLTGGAQRDRQARLAPLFSHSSATTIPRRQLSIRHGNGVTCGYAGRVATRPGQAHSCPEVARSRDRWA